MRTVTLAHAKAHLSALLDDAQAGRLVVITRRGRRVARIVGDSASGGPTGVPWVTGLRDFVQAQAQTGGSSVADMRGAEPR